MAQRKRRAFGKITERPKKKRGRYEASYPTPLEYCEQYKGQRPRQWRNFDTRDEAEIWLHQERRLIELGSWSPVELRKAEAKRRKESTVTFAQYAEHWIETRRKPDGSPRADGTVKRNRTMLRLHLMPYFGDTPMDEVNVRQVKNWIDTTADTMKDAMTARHNSFVLLKAIFNTAATEPIDDEGDTLIAKSPVTGTVPRPPKAHKTVAVTDEQIWELYNVIREKYHREDLAVVPLIGLFEGCRVGEVLALRRCDVNRDTDEISVSASVKDANELDPDKPRQIVRGTTKTRDSTRVIPVAPDLRDVLYEYINKHVPEDPDAPLFRAPRSGGFLAENSFTEVYVKAREIVPGLSGCRFHDLRHNMLTKISAAAGVAVAKRIAGHSDVRVTGGYLDAVTGDDMRKAIGANAVPSAAKPASAAAGSDVASWARTLAALDPAVRAQVLKELPAEMQARVMLAMFQQGEVS